MNLHVLVPFLVALVAGYLMIAAGLSKRALELKRANRPCPSCGRATRDCRCTNR